MGPILNISSYKFVALHDLPVLREQLLARCRQLELKGTILIAEEGINLFLAAGKSAIRQFIDWLREDPRFADLDPKESWSDHQPFRKMLVKIKREIIRMDHPAPRRPCAFGLTLHPEPMAGPRPRRRRPARGDARYTQCI